MENSPFVSIIIPTYNRAHLLPITLESFLSQDYPHDCYEIILADNNSSDATRVVANQFVSNSVITVKYIFEPRQGVHYARNSAAMHAKGDILYFTDDDMVADPTLLTNLVKVFSYDPLIGCATGKILPKFEAQPPKWVERYLMNSYLSLTERNKPESLVISSVDMVFSCHQAILREVFFKAGGFNPENTAGVWIGDGETGLNIKIKSLGYLFAYTSRSIIYHIIPQDRLTLSYFIRRIGNQGYCDSYTNYRMHRQRCRILPEMIKRSTIGAVKLLLLTVGRVMFGIESWHFIPARIAYIYKRNIYDLKLYFNGEFRRVAEIDNWLTVDLCNLPHRSKS